MTKIRRTRAGCNAAPAESLPLWLAASERDRRLRWQRAPLAARLLARRAGYPIETAAALAALAGMGGKDER